MDKILNRKAHNATLQNLKEQAKFLKRIYILS